MRNIVLGVTGGIAAYKACELIRTWTSQNYQVQVVMTENATRFITRDTLAVLSGREAFVRTFPEQRSDKIVHIDLSEWADVMVVAPATANIIAKFARGIADDLLSTAYLAHTGPVVVAPAMNSNMWNHPAVRENIVILENHGVHVVYPGTGDLACGTTGTGRLADLDHILDTTARVTNPEPLLKGKKIFVTAGATREHLDPVRFITNASSGKMGSSIARAAWFHGAEVHMALGPSSIRHPFGVTIHPFTSAEELERIVLDNACRFDMLFMAAAVGDFTPENRSSEKLGRENASLIVHFKATDDILKKLSGLDDRPKVIAFAAESGLDAGRILKKMKDKHADVIVANDISRHDIGFESDDNQVTLFFSEKESVELPKNGKNEIARQIIQHVVKHERLV